MAHLWDISAKVALFRSEEYSVTTSRHKSYVGRALREAGYRTFIVPIVASRLSWEDHSKNLANYEARASRLLEKADRARLHRQYYMARPAELLTEMKDYAEYFGLDKEETFAIRQDS